MMIDPETALEVSDTNGSHPDVVLEALSQQADDVKVYDFDFEKV
jgi:hypothetical protein